MAGGVAWHGAVLFPRGCERWRGERRGGEGEHLGLFMARRGCGEVRGGPAELIPAGVASNGVAACGPSGEADEDGEGTVAGEIGLIECAWFKHM